jgi:tetratricopeptide (TPR) repeat protein
MKHFRYIFLLIIPILLSSCFGSKNTNIEPVVLDSDAQLTYDALFLEAMRLKTTDRLEESLIHLEKALEINPVNAVLHYQLAEVNTKLGNFKAAMHYAENAVLLDEDNIWYHNLLVQLYQNAGLFAKASQEMEAIIRLDPRQFESYFMLSALYQSIGDSKSAINVMNRAEKEFGIMDVISVEKESIYLDAGKPDKAIKEIQKLIETFPDVPNYQALLAELYISIQNYSKAEEIYNSLDKQQVTNGHVLLAMSEFYRGIKDYEKAFNYLKKSFADPEMDVDIKVEMLVSMLTGSGSTREELDTQKEVFDILIQTHPENPKALSIYSDYLVKAGRYAEARETLRLVLKTERDKYPIWEQVLYIDNHLSDYETMLHDSDTAMILFPVQSIPYLFNSLAAYFLNMNEKALESANAGFSFALDDDVMKMEFLTLKAESYYRLKNYHRSDSLFEEVLKINPENVPIINNYAYYLSVRGEKLQRAKELGEKLIELSPDNASHLDTYGWILFMLEDYEQAEIYLKKALEMMQESRSVILEHYGDVLFKLGKVEEAIEYWKKAAENEDASKTLKQKIETGQIQ